MKPFKILLVDDAPQVLKALERMLRPKGYELFMADSGHGALDILRAHDIDLIVTDEFMPGLSGTDLLEVLKKLYPDIIRIMLTGLDDVETLKNAVNKGEIYRFFTKPWDDFELSLAIYQGLQQRALERENARLKTVACSQEKMLKQLEKEYPGISERKLTADGSFIIEG